MKDLCFIDKIGPYYRESIYTLLAENLNCEFFFSDINTSIKLLDFKDLKGFRKNFRHIKIFRNFYWLRGAIKEAALYKKAILCGDPHALHIWFILLFGKLTGRKVYLWTHGSYGNDNFVKRTLKKILFGLAEKSFIYGKYGEKSLIEIGIPARKLRVIYNSLDYDKQLEIRRNLARSDIYKKKFGNSDPVLFFIGRITKVKRLDLVVELIAELVKRGKPCNLAIIGKDGENVNLEAIAAKHNLQNRLWLYGPSYDEIEIANLIHNADLCVSPGNIGLTAMHVMAFGCPAITHDSRSLQMPEFEAIKEGLTGGFFKKDDLADMADCAEKWLARINENRGAIAQNCYAEIDSLWNPHHQIKIFEEELK